ncbi:MAG: Flagellar protein FliS [Pseudomonadota bacterium]|jgi:flagellar protein FliS
MSAAHRAASFYKQVDLESSVATADKHQLIALLFDGLISSLVAAEHQLDHNNIRAKCDSISRACRILVGLQGSLDHEKGGEIARNLADLYAYAMRRLFKANIDNDKNIIVEVRTLLSEIQEAWATVPEILREQKLANA